MSYQNNHGNNRNNYNNNYSNTNRNYNRNNSSNQYNFTENEPNTNDYNIKYEKLNGDNYVDIAKDVIDSFKKEKIKKEDLVTSTQLRNLLSMISDIYNDVVVSGSTIEGNNDQLISEITTRINYLKIKFVYESGREKNVKRFIERANILSHLNSINKSKKQFILFSRYMEALVAYRKYRFEGDN